jgi:anti-anti-sigma factor
MIDATIPNRPVDADGCNHALVSHWIDRHGIAVAVHGEVDLATAPQLARQLREALCLPTARLTLDLSDVQFMDSQGLHVLEDARLAAIERNVDFVVVAPSGCVRRLLDVTGTTDLFEIRASRAAT